jgi:hypothetical protein
MNILSDPILLISVSVSLVTCALALSMRRVLMSCYGQGVLDAATVALGVWLVVR